MVRSRTLTAAALALVILGGTGSAFAATHSDFTKSYPLQTLKTFAFKQQNRISRDPLANNDIWATAMRQAIRSDLREHGIVEATNGNPDFYVAFYVGMKERYDINYMGYGFRCSTVDSAQDGGAGLADTTSGRCRTPNPR